MTNYANFPATLDRIEARLSSLTTKVDNMATVLVDLQGAEARISADLNRAAAIITQLSQGHTVADADVEAVVASLKAAADAFDAANPAAP